MACGITPFLTFEGRAEEAMRFYVSLFPNSEIKKIERYGPGSPARRKPSDSRNSATSARIFSVSTARCRTPSPSLPLCRS